MATVFGCFCWVCIIFFCFGIPVGWQRLSIKRWTLTQIPKQTDWQTLVAAVPMQHARCRCTWQMPTIDIDSRARLHTHQPLSKANHSICLSVFLLSPSHSLSISTTLILCIHLTIQAAFATHLPLICQTFPLRSGNPDNWWAAFASLCFIFSAFCLSLSPPQATLSKERND